MAPSPDWASLMAPVARDLLDPERGLPREYGRELRYGRRGSMSVDLDRGLFFDHECDVGGGVLDLVRHVRGCGRSDALAWLRDGGYLPRDGMTRATRIPAPSMRSVRPPPSGPDDAVVHARRALVRAVWASGDLSLDGPARAYLESRRVWTPFEYQWVRWLPRECAPAPVPQAKWSGLPRGACGALVCAYVRDGTVVAVFLEALGPAGRRLPDRWRRMHGFRAGAAFRVREEGPVLHIAEGEVDALALARSRSHSGAVYGAGGTSGVASCDALVGGHREIVIHADGGGPGRRAAVRGLASVRARGLRAQVCWYRGDPAEEVER